MASIRARERADGTTAYAVLYKLGRTQTATTFDDLSAAQEFKEAVDSIGAERAMRAWQIGKTVRAERPKGPTVREWITKHIASRTGVTKSTIWDYQSYLKHDIGPSLGDVPLEALTRDDIAEFVQELVERDLSGKTIANRHGFLSAALKAAVEAELIASNPASGTRLPRSEKQEMVFLTDDEFDILREGFTPRWRPMIDFMVYSGTRFGEMTALTPADINVGQKTVRISRAWKRTYDERRYELGPTKTKKSNRTLNVPAEILEALDLSSEFVFTNTVGKPIWASEFRNNVWYPSVRRAQAKGLTKRPRIHDMRHTCASWMIADGTNLPMIQQHLGHESISTTVNLYGHLDRKAAEAAAETMGQRLKRRTP